MTTEQGSTAAPPAASAFSSSHWGRRMAIVTVPVCLDVSLRLLHPDLHVTALYCVGIGVLLLGWVIALGARSPQANGWAGWTIPIVVLAAVGLLRVVPEPTGLGIIAALPAMWLGVDKRLPGVAVASAAVLVTQAAPGLISLGPTAATWVGSVQLCLVATICALSQSWIADGWRTHESQLHERQVQLSQTMRRLSAGQALNGAIMNAVDVGLVGLRRDGTYSAMNSHHKKFMESAFPDGHRGYAGQLGWVFDEDGTTFLTRDKMPTVRAHNGEEFSDYVIWVGEEPAERRALAVSAKRVDGGGDDVAAVLVYKDVTDLVRALRVRDEFVATVSHELRTPLTSILGYLDLAVTDVPERDPRRGYLEVVQRNARRLLRLVNDLLLTAQTERGVLDLDRCRVDLSEVVSESIDDLRARAEAVDVSVELDVQREAWVAGDRERLAEVIDNLITNAVKYSHVGGTVWVRLAVAQEDEAAPTVVLSVGDDGIGIAESDRRQLFTKFFRTQEAQRRAIQGVGLGLSISRSIVAGHGGSIEVESEQGVGTTFEVRLPLATGPSPDAPDDLSELPDSLGPARA